MEILRFPRLPEAEPQSLPPREEHSEPSEAAELMRRVAAGRRSALDDLLRMYWGAVVAYAARMLGDADAAHDIAQEAFLRVWERRREWKGGSVRVYLFRVARNLAVDELRRVDARERAAFRSDWRERPGPRTPDKVVEHNELRATVGDAVQELSVRRREAFTLVYLRGLSYREAAEIMDVSVKTVGNHLTAALAELRERLTPIIDSETVR